MFSDQGAVVRFSEGAGFVCGPGAVDVRGVTFEGEMTGDEYAVGISGAEIAEAFRSASFDDGRDEAPRDFSVELTGTRLLLGAGDLRGRATRGIVSGPLPVDPGGRYVFHQDAVGSVRRYGGLSRLEFLLYDAAGGFLRRYVPQDTSGWHSFVSGAAQVRVRFEIRNWEKMARGPDTEIDLSALSLLRLSGRGAEIDLDTSPGNFSPLVVRSASDPLIESCCFRGIDASATLFSGCERPTWRNNRVERCLSGLNITDSHQAVATQNVIDLRQKMGGARVNLKAWRMRAISGTRSNAARIQDNILLGASWGMEVFQEDALFGWTIEGNHVEAEYCGISMHGGEGNIVSRNTILLQGGTATRGIEIAWINRQYRLTANDIRALHPINGDLFGIVCTGELVEGSISGGSIDAPCGIFVPESSIVESGETEGPVISGVTIYYRSCGIAAQNGRVRILGNSLLPRAGSMAFYCHGAALWLQGCRAASLVSGNFIECDVAPALVWSAPVFQFADNRIVLKRRQPALVYNDAPLGDCEQSYDANRIDGPAPDEWLSLHSGTQGSFPGGGNLHAAGHILLGRMLRTGSRLNFVVTLDVGSLDGMILPGVGEGLFSVTARIETGESTAYLEWRACIRPGGGSCRRLELFPADPDTPALGLSVGQDRRLRLEPQGQFLVGTVVRMEVVRLS